MDGPTSSATSKSLPHSRAERRQLRRAFVASFAGTSLEWYDFAAYSSCAALIFGPLFFQTGDPLTATLQAFATYAVGYLSRPLGGIVFGRLGDVVGRKAVLVATLLLVGGATFLIGLLPTHDRIGIAAPALLVLLRFAQGVGIGGEWGGAVLLASEYARSEERGFWASAAQIGPAFGTLLANGVLALIAAFLSDAEFLAWGWRIAFLLSALLIGFGLWVRGRIDETPVFRAVEAHGDRPRAPVGEVLRTQRRGVATVILARIGPDILYSLFAVFTLAYATQHLGLGRRAAVAAVLVGSALQLILIPLAGWLSDRWGRRTVYAFGTIGGGAWALLFFAFATDLPSFFLGVVVGLMIHSFAYGPQAAFIAEQFHARLRYTGSAIGYTLASVVGGGIAPLIFTWLLSRADGARLIGLYVAVACGVTLIGLRLGRVVPDEVDLIADAARGTG